jgi:sec-independent protein translocase protein TatB
MIGGLSMTELVIILGLALLLLGPDQLPTLAKTLGKGLRELRKATDDIKGQFEQEIASIDMDDGKTRRMIAPLQTTSPAAGTDSVTTVTSAPAVPNDPAAARAGARIAASAAADDPAGARAAARRASIVPPPELPGHGEPISFPTAPVNVAPEGTVPARESKA